VSPGPHQSGRTGTLCAHGTFHGRSSIPAAFLTLLPKWVVGMGLVLAAAGELSWFHLISPKMLFLIPLLRFPRLVGVIAVGLLLLKTRPLPPPSSSRFCPVGSASAR